MIPAQAVLPLDTITLWQEFTKARDGLQALRPEGSTSLSTAFYTDVARALFTAVCGALANPEASSGRHQRCTFPAPPGSGKSSAALALVAAVVRCTNHACLWVVHDITAAERTYQELRKLLPGKVAVWSGEHDKKPMANPKYVTEPTKRYAKTDLAEHRVAIVTDKFLMDVNGHKATHYNAPDGRVSRSLTIIDEQPQTWGIYDVMPSDAQAVVEVVESLEGDDEVLKSLRALSAFMLNMSAPESNRPRLERPDAWGTLSPELYWFVTEDARRFAKAHTALTKANGEGLPVDALFKFGRTLATERVFVCRAGKETRFTGYKNTFPHLDSGVVVLDATGDIGGLTEISPSFKLAPVPQARYDNLTVHHVKPYTNKPLGRFLRDPKRRQGYVTHLLETIRAFTKPGDHVLVVCKKCLIELHAAIPNWASDDPKRRDPKSYKEGFGWEFEGRHVAVINWGSGRGDNRFKAAEVVIAFDEFHKPRRVTMGKTQALLDAKASEGPVARMKAPHSRSKEVDTIEDGDLRAELKQLALRGNARAFDENGVCGKQTLVFAGDYGRLHGLFPGAVMPHHEPEADASLPKALIAILSTTTTNTLTTAEVSQALGVEFRTCSKRLLAHKGVERALRHLGWRCEKRRGRGGSRFIRDAVAVPPGGRQPLNAVNAH